MLGIFSFMSASKGLIVPGLDFIPPYIGEYMGVCQPPVAPRHRPATAPPPPQA